MHGSSSPVEAGAHDDREGFMEAFRRQQALWPGLTLPHLMRASRDCPELQTYSGKQQAVSSLYSQASS